MPSLQELRAQNVQKLVKMARIVKAEKMPSHSWESILDAVLQEMEPFSKMTYRTRLDYQRSALSELNHIEA